jgi:hypothetical protein
VANEVAAVACLRTYVNAQSVFHRIEHYRGRGLRYARPYAHLHTAPTGGTIKYIDEAFARACITDEKREPRSGYYFVDITGIERGAPYDPAIEFGLCAVPAKYKSSGINTFIVDVTGTVYQKDTGGRPVTLYPADLGGEGWIPVGME